MIFDARKVGARSDCVAGGETLRLGPVPEGALERGMTPARCGRYGAATSSERGRRLPPRPKGSRRRRARQASWLGPRGGPAGCPKVGPLASRPRPCRRPAREA